MNVRMPVKRLVTAVLINFLTISSFSWAAGVSEDSFSDWYGDMSERFETENVKNTGTSVFPTLLIPMGGEHEGMGTAYTAVSRDASFLEANPAASSHLEYTELALYHNNLIADTNMEGITYTTRFENLGIGVGGKHLHVPFTSYDDFGAQLGTARYTETVVAANVSYNFFSSFYFHGLSAGANLKAAYRNIPERIVADQSAAGVMTDLGLLTRLHFLKFYSSRNPNFSLGTVLRNVGPPVLDEPLPTTWSTGVAWSPFRPITLAADYNVPLLLFSDLPPPDPGYAVGAAVTVTDFFTMRTGFLMQGGNPRFTMGGSVGLRAMTITVNYTLDLTTQLTAFDRISVHAGFSFSDRGRSERHEMVRRLYLDALQAFAGGDLETTIALTRRALAIDPTFQPAAETLTMATRMNELQQRMESIRLGDDEVESLDDFDFDFDFDFPEDEEPEDPAPGEAP
ncbi:MAG: hypothetical protein EA427_05860 [Spirochaetaceae bacterium]|nr:MAG: hypothetical protein EA427_05860 [Spirochaetaceae bacterium]